MPDGYRIGPDEGELILWYWAQSMVKRFSSIPTHQILQYANTNDGIVTTGVLAGKERDGSVWLRAMMITYSSSEGLSLRKNVLTSNDPPTAYFAVGKSDIFTEFEGDKTSDRAIAERRSWKRLKLKGRPFDRFKARRLVELTVLYHTPRTDVGGDVDEIELIGTGKPHWIQVKPQCKNNYSP
jgi:hypothetical protein